jgi:hypothetical protein
MLKKMSPETLQATAKVTSKMRADAQKEFERQKEWINTFVTRVAETELAHLDIPGRSREALEHFLDEFERCFAGIITDDGDYCHKVYALGAVEAAAAIMALSRPDDDILKQIRRKTTKPARDEKNERAAEKEWAIKSALLELRRKEKIPLKTGDKYVAIYIRPRLPAYLPEAFELPSDREIRGIISLMKKERHFYQ